MAFSEGQNVGPYRIVAQMGHGGMATVYRAYHARLDRTVAIKVMHQAFMEDQNFLARFEREAQIVAKLEHPHIVPVYDFADYEGQPYLVMKYIEGRTLKAANERGALSLDDMMQVLPPIADALDYAHRQGVLHRDIKPSNIILGSDGIPYLTDFGLARLAQLGQSTLSADLLVGTPNYISPEQAMGRTDLDSRTDLYSLGVVLYELVVGQVPFSADTPFAVIHDHIYRPLPAPSSMNPDVTPEIEAVLVKALAKNPAERYGTASEMIAAFRQAVHTSGLSSLKPDRVDTAAESLAQARTAQDAVSASTPPRRAPDEEYTLVDEVPAASEKPKRYEDDFRREHSRPPRSRDRHVEAAFDFNLDNAGRALAQVGDQVRSAVESGIAWMNGQDDELASPHDENALRRRVERQVKKRSEFNVHLVTFIFVNILLWMIYSFASGVLPTDLQALAQEFPWPLIVTFGWGSGLLAHFIETYYQTGARAAARLRAIHGEFERLYGDRWYATVSKSELKKVRSRVEQPFTKRREFASHLAVYVTINAMLWFIYLFAGGAISSLLGGDFALLGFPWPLIVMFGWGIGLVAHAAEVFTTGNRQRAIDRAVERERATQWNEKPKRDRYYDEEDQSLPDVRLNADGEFTDSMIEEIDEDKRARRR
jgi:serine/threonine protein kinase